MSIPVPLPELEATLMEYPWGYLMTVTAELRAHSMAVSTQFIDGVFAASVGRGTMAHVAARPNVSMVFPPQRPGGYSLIVDGLGSGVGDHVEVTPTSAVLHRPAPLD